MNKVRVIILFGGRSAEHEISLLSARNVFLALDRTRFEPVLIGIDKRGRWRVEPESTLLNAKGDPRHLRLLGDGNEIAVPVRPGGDASAEMTGPGTAGSASGLAALFRQDDVVFPVLHGTYGEDGTVQGLLELADVAYVGAGHLGSAAGMDKDVTKRLLDQAGLPVVPWRLVRAADLQAEPEATLTRAAELGFPCFVKPCNAGSSVGVSKVKSASDLRRAIELALTFDGKVLIEAAVDAREIECAVLGNDRPEASIPGEIVVTHSDGFYSYDAKYVDEQGAHWQIPADVAPDVAAQIRNLAIRAFGVLELAGMARVDFFLDRTNGSLFVNEVNTIPGFTAISMYPKMWEATGLPVQQLVSRLLDLATARKADRRRLRTSF